MHLMPRQGLGAGEASGAVDGRDEIEPRPSGRRVVDACQQGLARSAAHHPIRKHQPYTIGARAARQGHAGRDAQSIENRPPIHDRP